MEQTNVTPGNKNFLSGRPPDFWPVLTLAADVTVVLKPTKNCTEFLGIQLVVRSSRLPVVILHVAKRLDHSQIRREVIIKDITKVPRIIEHNNSSGTIVGTGEQKKSSACYRREA
ncbi:uncharacterized protein LOC119768687 [Culex quinquefasciatus]|uniref:uncharacterized protein LOC119768687 n=1 Tax=Culex quinquefasciatus TaxID=7176 RepID=UPI0018E387F8|nr:uncharacterized protein LOC119768687 [Culex quinquefasciatus]